MLRNYCPFILGIIDGALDWPSVDNVDSYHEVLNLNRRPTCLQIYLNTDILQKLGTQLQKLKNYN